MILSVLSERQILLRYMLIGILSFFIFNTGCANNNVEKKAAINPDTKKEEAKVFEVVKAYNNNSIEAIKTFDVSKVKKYTTDKQFRYDELRIAIYKEKQKVKEIDELIALKVAKVNVDMKQNTAQVTTNEVWRVRQESLKTKKITDYGEIYYITTYKLIKDKGIWLVDLVEAKEYSEAIKNKEK